jgi:Flp pilus assembly protein TadB
MNFCANCGTNLKPTPQPVQAATPAPAPMPSRQEKHEKQEKEEKHEKTEKTEKHEKQQYGPIGPIIGGIILIALGAFFYLTMIVQIDQRILWAFFFIVIGIAIILAVIFGVGMASRRHPPT